MFRLPRYLLFSLCKTLEAELRHRFLSNSVLSCFKGTGAGPWKACIKSKTLVLAYQVIKGSAPAYIQKLITCQTSPFPYVWMPGVSAPLHQHFLWCNPTIVLLTFKLYSYLFFGAPTAHRAFWAIDTLQTVTVRYRSQAVLVFQRFCFYLSIFLYCSFYSFYFPIYWNGEMLIGVNSSHDYSTTVLAELHISSCLNANVSHTTLTYRHITKHIWHYKPHSLSLWRFCF